MKLILWKMLCGFLFCLPGLLVAGEPGQSRWQDIAFHPDAESGSYMEVWNFSHHQKDLSLYITFLVSNIGPGDLNNGISVILFQKGRSKIFTAEYAEESLRAHPGRFGIQSGRSYFRRCKNRCIELKILLDHVRLELRLDKIRFGPKLNDNDFRISENPRHFLRAFLPIQGSRSTGSLHFGKTKLKLAGHAGMEYMRTNRSPHKYAKSVEMLRSYGSEEVSLGYLEALPEFRGKTQGRILIRERGRTLFHDYIKSRKILHRSEHPEFGLTIPDLIEYRTLHQNCRLLLKRRHNQGGVYVLGHISALLRWVLAALFAKPYILYYQASLQVSCDLKKNRGLKKTYSNLLSAVYLIHP